MGGNMPFAEALQRYTRHTTQAGKQITLILEQLIQLFSICSSSFIVFNRFFLFRRLNLLNPSRQNIATFLQNHPVYDSNIYRSLAHLLSFVCIFLYSLGITARVPATLTICRSHWHQAFVNWSVISVLIFVFFLCKFQPYPGGDTADSPPSGSSFAPSKLAVGLP
jgi:hypothetical protein